MPPRPPGSSGHGVARPRRVSADLRHGGAGLRGGRVGLGQGQDLSLAATEQFDLPGLDATQCDAWGHFIAFANSHGRLAFQGKDRDRHLSRVLRGDNAAQANVGGRNRNRRDGSNFAENMPGNRQLRGFAGLGFLRVRRQQQRRGRLRRGQGPENAGAQPGQDGEHRNRCKLSQPRNKRRGNESGRHRPDGHRLIGNSRMDGRIMAW